MQNILGQQQAIDVLQAALRSDRIHHAWIFAGPPGVGKFTTAVEFARILLDPASGPNLAGIVEHDPTSESSRLIDASMHPDLHIIRKELALYSSNKQLHDKKQLNIPIDVLREYMIGGVTSDGKEHQGPVFLTPARNHSKVFIVDEAELIDNNGMNAILKTLEEPPPHTYIILVTSRIDRLLPTIRSRCQHVRFGPLDDESIAAWLRAAKLDVQPRELAWIERFAQGSPGMALVAAQYGFFGWHTTLEPMIDSADRGRFPIAMGETMAKLVDEFAAAWVKAHANASKDAANKAGARHLLAILASHARSRLRESGAGTSSERAPEKWMDLIDLLREAESQLHANVNMKLLFENLAVQWTQNAARTPLAA